VTFDVEVSRRAEDDARRIARWIAKRSPQGARSWYDAFAAMIDSLAASAEQHPRAPEDGDHAETIRNAFFRTRRGRTYRAIYVFRADTVFVTHVRGPRQRPVQPDRFYPRSDN